jgi:hypothetical protein
LNVIKRFASRVVRFRLEIMTVERQNLVFERTRAAVVAGDAQRAFADAKRFVFRQKRDRTNRPRRAESDERDVRFRIAVNAFAGNRFDAPRLRVGNDDRNFDGAPIGDVAEEVPAGRDQRFAVSRVGVRDDAGRGIASSVGAGCVDEIDSNGRFVETFPNGFIENRSFGGARSGRLLRGRRNLRDRSGRGRRNGRGG